MRMDYTVRGEPRPIYEVGDFVRLKRDEPGPVVTARAGDWGRVTRVSPRGVDVMLAGYCRPANARVSVATGLPVWMLAPCDTRGLMLDLQRDLERRG
jgi:hypothetical protein